MQTIYSLAYEISYTIEIFCYFVIFYQIVKLLFNCITSYIFRDINQISLKPEDLDRLCCPDFIDIHTITVKHYKQAYEEQRAYVDAYKQVVEMQGLVIADLEQKLKNANNVINGYERFSPVEYFIKYEFYVPKILTYELYEPVYTFDNGITDVYYFGGVKVLYHNGECSIEYDNTIIDANISLADCDCKNFIEFEKFKSCKVKGYSLSKVKDRLLEFDIPVIIKTDADTSEDDYTFIWEDVKSIPSEDIECIPCEDVKSIPSEEHTSVYVVGLEYKTFEEKEKIAKINDTIVDYLQPIQEKPNIWKFAKSCHADLMDDLIKRNSIKTEFEDYVEELKLERDNFPTNMSIILTYIYDELTKNDDILDMYDLIDMTPLYYEDNIYNDNHYMTRIAFILDVGGWVDYYVKLEIITEDGKKHDSSNISDSFKFCAYKC